jgi:hypothetical protein
LRCVGSGAGLTDESRKLATRDVETELTRSRKTKTKKFNGYGRSRKEPEKTKRSN